MASRTAMKPTASKIVIGHNGIVGMATAPVQTQETSKAASEVLQKTMKRSNESFEFASYSALMSYWYHLTVERYSIISSTTMTASMHVLSSTPLAGKS